MKIAIIYFSATGNTAKMARAISRYFMDTGAETDEYDITSYSSRKDSIDLQSYQACVFGSPIYSWRAPRVMREWMRTQDGKNMKCSMFFTYGGFGVHPAHYSTRQILTEQNFVVVSSAEFLGAHTFNLGGWKAMSGRPDGSDYEIAKRYVEKTYRRFTGEDREILGELEKTSFREEELDQIESFRFHILTKLPTRDGEECSMCMLCEELCPKGAIKAEDGQADSERCIACLRCVANCPEGALKINNMSDMWSFKLEMEKETEESLKNKQSKIYL
jgi:ferredoxin